MLTSAEYLALEAVIDRKDRLEYSHGTVLAAGEPSQDHQTIVANLTLTLGPAVRAAGCRFWMKQNLRRPGSFSHDPTGDVRHSRRTQYTMTR